MGSDVVTLSTAAALPHALASDALENLKKEITEKSKQVVFFLDFDGTLAPIVPNPDSARMLPETKTVLQSLVENYPTTIVTGRAIAKVKSFIEIHDNLAFAGSHGFDIDAPGIGTITMGVEHLPALKAVRERLAAIVERIPGAHIEDNRLSISVHYRHVEPKDVEGLAADVKEEVLGAGMRLHDGKYVWEVRPKFDWHKGKAVEYLLQKLGMDSERYLPIYIGDDVTDEDAFGVLPKFGGVGVIVYEPKDSNQGPPRQSKATMRVRDTKEVAELLRFFAANNDFRKCSVTAHVQEVGVSVGTNAAS